MLLSGACGATPSTRNGRDEFGAKPCSAYAAVSNFLNSHERIRIFVNQGPGHGLASSSVSLMRWMVDIGGYEGDFELVYQEGVEESLRYLLPKFHPQVPQFSMGASSVSIRVLPGDRSRLEPLKLGVTGGDDDVRAKASELAVSYRIQLHPNPDQLSLRRSFLDVPGEALIDLPAEENLQYVTSVPQVSELDAFLQAQLPAHTKEEELRRAQIVRALLSSRTDVMPVYGVGSSARVIANLARAAKEIARQHSSILPHGVTIALLGGLTRTRKLELERLLVETGVRLSDASDSSLRESDSSSIARAILGGEYDVHVVAVGRVTKGVFEQLYRRSRLPVLVSGANATALAINLGKPYLNSYARPVSPASAESWPGASQDDIDEANSSIYFGHVGLLENVSEHLQEYLLAGLDPSSPLARFHRAWSPWSLPEGERYRRDLLAQGLLAAERELRSRKLLP